MRPRLHVIAIGGQHQFLHFLPPVFALHERGAVQATIFVPRPADGAFVEELAARLGLSSPPVVVLRLPGPLDGAGPAKLARLLWWSRRLRSADAVLAAERTSTILRRLPTRPAIRPGERQPLFLHIPHGAGDRAQGFEKRIALFDHVLVAGRKDRDRVIDEGLLPPSRSHVIGPVKLAAIARMGGASIGGSHIESGRIEEAQGARERTRLFANDRPVILYNPHFHRRLGTFEQVAGRLIEAITRDGRYNLVVAPHVRLAHGWSRRRREAWEARSVPGRIVVDLGSPRSSDMTYTLGADLYIGDVSSQNYEFLAQPRPCLFIDRRAHDAEGRGWRDDPDFAMWHFGPVVAPSADLVAAIDRTFASHASYREHQVRRTAQAFGDGEGGHSADDPIERAAACIMALIDRSPPQPSDR